MCGRQCGSDKPYVVEARFMGGMTGCDNGAVAELTHQGVRRRPIATQTADCEYVDPLTKIPVASFSPWRRPSP